MYLLVYCIRMHHEMFHKFIIYIIILHCINWYFSVWYSLIAYFLTILQNRPWNILGTTTALNLSHKYIRIFSVFTKYCSSGQQYWKLFIRSLLICLSVTSNVCRYLDLDTSTLVVCGGQCGLCLPRANVAEGAAPGLMKAGGLNITTR